MKLLLLTALALLPTLTVPDFGGGWTLDQARSTGLPPHYANVRSHRLAVTQGDSSLLVRVVIDAGRAQPDTFRFDYPFGGREAATTTRVRTNNGPADVPTRLKATRNADGTIHITVTRELAMFGESRTVTGTEDWSLADDGRTLVVERRDELPQGGEMRSRMVFARE